MGEKLSEGKGRKERDEDRRDSPTSLPGSLRQPPLPSLAGWGRGPGSRGPRRPSRAGRSLGKARRPYSDLLGCPPQLYNLLPQPGGRGRWTDRRMDGQTGPGRAGRAGGGPSRDGEPPTRTHRHELVCGEGPARSVLRVGARTQESGPPAPSSPRNPGVSLSAPSSPKDPESRSPSPHCSLRFKSPSPQAPLLPRGPRRPGPRPLPQSRESSQACLLRRRRSPASWIPGPRELHQFQSLDTWASSLPDPTCQIIGNPEAGRRPPRGYKPVKACLGICSSLTPAFGLSSSTTLTSADAAPGLCHLSG